MSERIIKFESGRRGSSKGRSTLYYRPAQKDFLQEFPDGRSVAITERAAVKTLVFEKAASDPDEAHELLYKVRRDAAIDYDGPMPGYRRGLHEEAGQRYFCSSEPQMLESVVREETDTFGAGWPVIHELLRRLLVNEEVGWDQFYVLLASLKNGALSLRYALAGPANGGRRSVRPGQAVALVGPRACGKTFLFERVIAPLLGGRVVDAFKAFMSESQGFNGELLTGEVWKIDDRECSTDIRVRRQFAANLKAHLYSSQISIHRKYCTPFTLIPFGRLFIMCNDTDENLRVLPDVTPDIPTRFTCCAATRPARPCPLTPRRNGMRTGHRSDGSYRFCSEIWSVGRSRNVTLKSGVVSGVTTTDMCSECSDGQIQRPCWRSCWSSDLQRAFWNSLGGGVRLSCRPH